MSSLVPAAWTALLLLFGTFLAWVVFVEPAPWPFGWFVASGFGVYAWWRSPATQRQRTTETHHPIGSSGCKQRNERNAENGQERNGPFPCHLALILGAGLVGWIASGFGVPQPHLGALTDVLFSSQGGLLFWSPVLWLGLVGLVLLFRRHPERAGVLAVAVMVFVLMASALPGPRNSPGPARFAPLLALLAPGVAASLAALTGLGRRRPGVILSALGALAVLSNLLFMHQYRAGLVPRDDTVSFPQVAESSARLISESVGSPVAWPANWIYARQQGVPLGRTDLLKGANLSGGVIDIGALEQDAALLFEGWSVRRPCAPEICREVEGRARLLAPLGTPETRDLTVRAAGEGTLTVELNGVPIAQYELTAALQPLAVRVPAPRFRAPLDEIVLVVSPGGRALVDRLSFSRLAL